VNSEKWLRTAGIISDMGYFFQKSSKTKTFQTIIQTSLGHNDLFEKLTLLWF
jgi:hypothetical protein